MAKTTINLSERDLEIIAELKEHFNTGTLNDAIRQSIAQSSVLSRYVNEDNELVVEKQNGDKVALVYKG